MEAKMENHKKLFTRGLMLFTILIFMVATLISCNSNNKQVETNQTDSLTKINQPSNEISQKEGITYPSNNQCVQKGTIEIKWNPADTPMVIQYYQKGKCLLNCTNGEAALSGEKITINTTGETEIKIWKKNAEKPFSSIWVYVKESCK
jgi:hypothetical protein